MFFRTVFCWSILAVLFSCSEKKSETVVKSKPNILVLIADDWSYPHAGVYGDSVVKTPTFDRIAETGVLFQNAFCASPSCTASRGSILTGLYPHQLEEGVNLWSSLSTKFPTYTSILEQDGYLVGFEQKGWAPGNIEAGGYQHNPSGVSYDDFKDFYKNVKKGQSFCYWFGSRDPHRPYEKGSGKNSGLNPDHVKVPNFLPDSPEVRNDILDYYFEVERFDRECADIITFLDSIGQLDNTIVLITSDNGMPFPRAKANLYDAGSKVPLAVSWNGVLPKGVVYEKFVNLIDIAPTLLSAAIDTSVTTMAGTNLMPFLMKDKEKGKNEVFLERERHAYVRNENLGYPIRAVRTNKFLYIDNLKPDRWPAGNPELVFAVGAYGDIDASPTKDYMLENFVNKNLLKEEVASSLEVQKLFQLAFLKRPSEELYDLEKDPYQLNNIIEDKTYANTLKELKKQLLDWRIVTDDPRLNENNPTKIDSYPYYGHAKKEE
jgi:arylsulfatase A-like enzyme